jgi:actin-related protein
VRPLLRYAPRLGAFALMLTRLNPCSVGRPKHVRAMAGALEGETFIGKKAQEYRGLLKIKYPMEHGIVTDWDDMERIWSWIYSEELGTLSEEVRPRVSSRRL